MGDDYLATELGALGGVYSEAFGVNEHGHVVGRWMPPGGPGRAFLYEDEMTDLGTLAGGDTVANAIDGSGRIVGRSDIDDGDRRAFLYENGTMTDITPALGATWATAQDINENGIIAGAAIFKGAVGQEAFMFKIASGEVTKLGAPQGCSLAMALNSSGEAVGGFSGCQGGSHPFLFSGGQMIDIAGKVGTAWHLNDAGHVVGSTVADGAFLYSNGQMSPLPVNGLPYGINQADQIVGWGIGETPLVTGPDQFGFLVTGGNLVNLTDVLVPQGWDKSSNAHDINEKGQIVGSGRWFSQLHAFLLTPVPTPIAEIDKTITLVAEILFGVASDGGGVVIVGGKPIPIGPWDPVLEAIRGQSPLRAKIAGRLAKNPRVLAQIRRGDLSTVERVVGDEVLRYAQR